MDTFSQKKPQYAARSWVVLAGVLAVVFTVFSSGLKNYFVGMDDPGHLLQNPYVTGLDAPHIRGMFHQRVNKTYIPLTTLSFAVEYRFFGLDALVYHLDNILLHMGVTALVFGLARRLGLSLFAAGTSAVLFGIHPMRVESVAWVTERKDVLYAFFYLLALHAYWSYLNVTGCSIARQRGVSRGVGFMGRQAGWFALSMISGLLSILAKPMALSLPFVLGILDWFAGRSLLNPRVLGEKFIHLAYIVPIAWISASGHGNHLPQEVHPTTLLFCVTWTLMFYIRKFLLPVGLTPIYEFPEPINWGNMELTGSVLLFCLYVWILWRCRGRRWFMFANAYFLFSIFFLVRLRPDSGVHVVADRFMYLPSLGFCFLIGICCERFVVRIRRWKGDTWAMGIVGGLVMAMVWLGVQTYRLVSVWANDETLWAYVLKNNKNNLFPYFARAKMYHEKGDYRKAIEDYSRVIAGHPRWEARAYNNRGILYHRLGQDAQALRDYNKVVELRPDQAKGYANRGVWYYEKQQDAKALRDLNKAIALDPKNSWNYLNRGLLYYATYQDAQALRDYTRAIRLNPRNKKAYFYRAQLLRQMRRPAAALADLRRALGLDPFYQEARELYDQVRFENQSR